MIGLKNEFASTNLESWIDQLKKDLKGEDFNKLLRTDTIEEISYPTFHNEESNKIVIQSPGTYPYTRGLKTKSNEWGNGFLLKVKDEKSANSKALEVLMKGCDLLLFDLNSCEYANYDLLCDGIQFEHIRAQFALHSESQYLGLKHYFGGKSPSNISISFDYFHFRNESTVFNTIVSDLKQAQYPCFIVDAYAIQQRGATTWQEIAFCISVGHEYLVRLMDQGLSIDEAAACIHFHCGIGTNYFYEIAKFRALRQVWASVIKEYQPVHNCSYNCSITAKVGFMNKSLKDPYTNLLRQTTEAMSALSGGVDNLIVQPYDAISDNGSSNLSERMALNISLILKEESYFDKVVDPLGGSYAIEHLTQTIAEKSWGLFQLFESNGGLFEEKVKNLFREMLREKASLRTKQITSNESTLIGINKFPNPDPGSNNFTDTEMYMDLTALIYERELIAVK